MEDGSTVHVMESLRGGGKHKDKKSKTEKKQVAGQESVSDKGPAILECKKDKVIQQIEENEPHRVFQERLRLDRGGLDICECGMRCEVVAKRKEAAEGKNEGH